LSGSIPLPDIRNGNGSADYLISGFDLSAINPGDRLLFQATWDHAVDGGESFYIVPVVNPRDKETSAGAFGPGFLLSYDRPQNAYGGWDIGGAGPSNVFAHVPTCVLLPSRSRRSPRHGQLNPLHRLVVSTARQLDGVHSRAPHCFSAKHMGTAAQAGNLPRPPAVKPDGRYSSESGADRKAMRDAPPSSHLTGRSSVRPAST